LVQNLTQDLRYACRQWAKSPGFALVCVLTIALGIGANTAIFSVMNTVLLRLLPVPNPQQLVYLHLKNQPLGTSQTGYSDTSLSLPVYEQMRAQRRVFSDVIALAPLAFGKVAVRFGREPEQAYGEMVSGNFFSGLGVRPSFGRGPILRGRDIEETDTPTFQKVVAFRAVWPDSGRSYNLHSGFPRHCDGHVCRKLYSSAQGRLGRSHHIAQN
jgi:hypothetical protein